MRTVVVGAGGHARSVIAAAREGGNLELVAATDPAHRAASEAIDGVPIVGGDERLPELLADGVSAAVLGVGSVSDNAARIRIHDLVTELGFSLPVVVHPTAVVADGAAVGPGSVVLAGAYVGPGARIGSNVIINTGAIVEHDCVVGAHAHVASGAVIGGDAAIGESAHVGLGAVVLQGIRVGAQSVVGAGAVVIRDVPATVTVVGVPASQHRTRP